MEKLAINSSDSVAKYNDSIEIDSYLTSFNLVDKDDKPDIRNVRYKSSTEHLNCPICQQPFIDPLTTVCGHTFCKDCIFECLKMSNRYETTSELSGCCPLDRTPLSCSNTNDLFPTPLLITNLIDDLKVHCLNNERGCDWEGSRWEVEHHVLVDCGYTGVKCNGVREEGQVCHLVVERRHLDEEHECIHKIISCNFCKQKTTKITQDTHLNEECLLNYQTCELCLNDMIPLKNLEKHQENCSKIGHVKCPAHEIGCKFIGNNETSLEIHLQSNNCQLNQFLPFYNKLNDKVESLTHENGFLQRQINKILDSIIQGKITNLGYNEAIEEINKYGIDDQDKLVYLNFEIDRLKFEIDEKLLPFMNKEKNNERENMMNNLINDNFMMREDLNLQRMLINSLRKQLQFLLFARRGGMMPGTNIAGPYGVNGSGIPNPASDDLNDLLDISSTTSSEERLNLKL
ncbi:uncharacterized protein CANTADRAFT_43419 [Suhomyces tanzawaensis NRRL Y-17324]|uniref:RING-type domain-containing protein n=1 Tax=Suhomyces tanzawaensis NRRL Y-17324 TaxID=984487 RepID=A0A1E4SR56_9ASCO|nr:uncharacterized protein CANTADRAFT_43419 [Suhomyces tanzawaensis NRRL Y-17324]ODV81978.1 hypothetical protein CANTADRAFT_43419 [Suhomyces tanzawaensis NRRL Y-17324]